MVALVGTREVELVRRTLSPDHRGTMRTRARTLFPLRVSHALALFLSSAICFGSRVPQSQKPLTLRVGDPSIDGTILRPYQNRFSQSTLLPDGSVREGVIDWTDELVESDLQGRRQLRRSITTYRIRDAAVLSFGGALFHPSTLAPVSSTETLSIEDYWHVNFDRDGLVATGVKVTKPRGSKPRFIHWTLEEPAFDTYNATFGLLYAALPLATRYSATLPVVSDDKSKLERLTMRVVGEEDVPMGGGVQHAWVVEDDSRTGPTTYWLIQAPPYILKMRKVDLASGLVFTWVTLL